MAGSGEIERRFLSGMHMFGTMCAALGALATMVGFMVLIVQGARWTQRIDDSVMQLVQIEERESAARIAGDLAQTEARKDVVRSLARIQEDHEEFRRWKMPAAVQPP
jgi:hypothetical protein